MQIELDEKYGMAAVNRTKQLKDNLLKWDCIEKIDEKDKEKLHSPSEYLKINDLIGTEIIVADVPNDMETDNEMLKQLLEKKKDASMDKKAKYNDLCCIELIKEFAHNLMNNKEMLEKLNIQVIGYKHKEKQNGYIAEHTKFEYIDHPEYTFEIQLRSCYRENLSIANGPAAHDKRSGKKRILPNITDKEDFINEIKRRTPQYTILRNVDGEFKLHKCRMAENVLEYYMGYIHLDPKEYEKVMQYITQGEQRQEK